MTYSSEQLATRIRKSALEMTHRVSASHIGTCFSMADFLAVLYNEVMCIDPQKPNWKQRDRFILSKGHGAAIYYALLAELGFFSKSMLKGYCDNGSILTGHVNSEVPGVDVSAGSLGHGLSIGCGMSLSIKNKGSSSKVYAIVSDGELDEGSVWESILFAPHHNLNNLVLIIDYNKIQSFGRVEEIINLEPISKKFESFNWDVVEIDGHDIKKIYKSLINKNLNKPKVIVANTIKGKGIKLFENDNNWHHSIITKSIYKNILKEL